MESGGPLPYTVHSSASRQSYTLDGPPLPLIRMLPSKATREWCEKARARARDDRPPCKPLRASAPGGLIGNRNRHHGPWATQRLETAMPIGTQSQMVEILALQLVVYMSFEHQSCIREICIALDALA